MLGTIILVALAILLLGTAGLIIRWLLRRPVLLMATEEMPDTEPAAAARAEPASPPAAALRWPPTIELDLPADSMTLPPAKKLPLKPPAKTPLAFAVVIPVHDSSVDLDPPDPDIIPPELPEVEMVEMGSTATGSSPRRLSALVSPSNGFDDMTVPDRGPHWSSSETQPGTRAAALRAAAGNN